MSDPADTAPPQPSDTTSTVTSPPPLQDALLSTPSLSKSISDLSSRQPLQRRRPEGEMGKVLASGQSIPVVSSILSIASPVASGVEPTVSVSNVNPASPDDSVNKLLQSVRSTNLPYPLPVPTYSQIVQAARASGSVLPERATIIRETVKFFLAQKYWWTSDDYDRIAEMVVTEFPELQDHFKFGNQPCYSKVRLDLSMCARNIRRIAKNQKRKSSSGNGSAETLSSPVVDPPTSKATPSSKSKSGGRRSKKVHAEKSTAPSVQSAGKTSAPQPKTSADGCLKSKNLDNLPYLLAATTVASPASTVLPPVAHFLGHASACSQPFGGIIFPSMVPASATNTTSSATSTFTPSHPVRENSTEMKISTSLTRSGLNPSQENYASLSAAWRPDAQLPNPLPVPPYSDKRRVRTDLSQTARNIRRREVMLRRRDSLSPEHRFSAVGTLTLGAGAQQAPTDFCHELLAAASIIESRNAALHHMVTSGVTTSSLHTTTPAITQESGIAHSESLTSTSVDEKKGDEAEEIKESLCIKTTPMVQTSVEADLLDAGQAGRGQIVEGVMDSMQESLTEGNKILDAGKEGEKDLSVAHDVHSKLAVIKHETDEDAMLEDYLGQQQQSLQAWQAISAQMSQALSMQALSAHMSQALSAQMTQALSAAAHMPEPVTSQPSQAPQSSPPTAHQAAPATTSPTLSLQQLSQVYGLTAGGEEIDAAHADRMSAMAMWRSTCLPDPLPTPPYSLNVLRARDSGSTASARPRIIRETTQFFLAMKMWWTTQDYERIAELVLRHFPALKNIQNIKKDLGTCARNMRRRLPVSRYKPSVYSKPWHKYDSLPHNLLKEAMGELEGETRATTGLTLGELATMASLREAVGQSGQDKAELGLSALTEEQRQALLAQSMYEQSSLAWNTLYQQQLAFSAAETASSAPQARGTKRSHSESSSAKLNSTTEKEALSSAVKRHAASAELNSLSSLDDGEVLRRHSLDISLTKEVLDMKIEPPVDHKSIMEGNDIGETLIIPRQSSVQSSHVLSSVRDQKPPAVDKTVLHGVESLASPDKLVFQNPIQAHSQPSSHIRHDVSTVEEAPINLTCSSGTTKHRKSSTVKEQPSSFRAKGSKSGNIEAFSAREQVWFPHGSPWKKNGQGMFKALPEPLPVPKYSQKLVKAKEEGLAYRHRSEIIRETARFFLGYKYWWSSADYSRISDMVVTHFPDLKDPVIHPGQPFYRRVQRDLSMCARNLRRKNTRRQKFPTTETTRSPKKSRNSAVKENKTIKAHLALEKQEALPCTHAGDVGDRQANFEADFPSSSVYPVGVAHSIMDVGTRQSIFTESNPMTDSRNIPLHTSNSERKKNTQAGTTSRRQMVEDKDWGSLPAYNTLASHILPTVASTNSTSVIQSYAVPVCKASTVVSTSHSKTANEGISLGQLTNATINNAYSVPETSVLGVNTASASPSHKEKKENARAASHKASYKSLDPSATQQFVKSSSSSLNMVQQHRPSVKSAVPASNVHMDHGKETLHKPASSRSRSVSSEQHTALARRPRDSATEMRTSSNATAIVIPTLSEAPFVNDSHTAGGSDVSHKVYIDPDHGSGMQNQLCQLWREGKFFDASLEVDGCRLPVHKLVLLAASPYLQSTFRHANPTSQLEVNLPRATGVRAAKDFLKYLYEGVLHVGPDSVHALRRIATMLQMEKLLMYCDDYVHLLNTSSRMESSHTNPLPRGSVPKVSVNLRDMSHAPHNLESSHRGLSTFAHTVSSHSHVYSMNSGHHASVSQPSEQTLHRRASAQSYQSYPVAGGVVKRPETWVRDHQSHGHRLGSHSSMEQENSRAASRLVQQDASRLVGHIQHASANDIAMLDPHDKVSSEESSNHEFQAACSQLMSEYQEHLHLALAESDRLNYAHNASVIQRGPNMASSTSYVGSSINSQDEGVHFLTDHGDSQQLQSEEGLLTETNMDEGDIAVLMTHSHSPGIEIVLDGETSLQHFTADGGGEVVAEVVVGAVDLLQEVEVAACETVECSLLPQTYCSSPEASQTHNSSPDQPASPSVSNLQVDWVSQDYKAGHGHSHWATLHRPPHALYSRQASLHSNQLPPNMDGSEGSSDKDYTKQLQDTGLQEHPTESYPTHGLYKADSYTIGSSQTISKDSGTISPQVAAVCIDSTNVLASHEMEDSENSQGSLLPQTYRSSPEHVASSSNGQ